MPRRPPLRNSDLRGVARLATDAAAGLTDLVATTLTLSTSAILMTASGKPTPGNRWRSST
jgi:hypothetical protein